MTHYYQICVNAPATKLFTYKSEHKLEIGMRVRVRFRNALKTGIVINETDAQELRALDHDVIKPISTVMDAKPLIREHSITVAQWIADHYCCTFSEALFSLVPSGLRTTKEDKMMPTLSRYTGKMTALSQEQSLVLQSMYNQHGYALKYLYGVAGSGKTELFVTLCEKKVAEGTQVLYLVPEIGLAAQLYPYLIQRIGNEHVVCYHSGLAQSKRLDAWKRFSDGDAMVMIGTRSAVGGNFLKPGYIIFDEEHDVSYKSDQKPRIHARDIAIKRAQLLDIPFVCGSATPSLEAWNYFRAQKHDLMILEKKYSGESPPKIIHQSLEHIKGVFSPALLTELDRSLKHNMQAILFVNRKGFANAFFCLSCGSAHTCAHCSVNMTYHATPSRLICYHCGYACDLPKNCHACGSVSLGIRGYGTHRVHSELSEVYPHARTEILDADCVDPSAILERFYKGTIDILVSTQIIAKGITIPRLNLVAILFLESFFSLPDFRAVERGHALLTQVMGRVGRIKDASFYDGSCEIQKDIQEKGVSRGNIVIQSFSQKNEYLEDIRTQDYRSILEKEINMRIQYQLPPIRSLCRILVRAKIRDKAVTVARQIADIVRDICHTCNDTAFVLGPNPCPIEKRASQYRIQVYLNAPHMQVTRRLLKQLLAVKEVGKIIKRRDVMVDFDLTPLSNL